MTTHDLAPPDLTDPIYTIEHIARLFFVSVDRAREYTYRTSFPAAAELGARNLWTRTEVIAWFEALPRRARPVTPSPDAPLSATPPTPAGNLRGLAGNRRSGTAPSTPIPARATASPPPLTTSARTGLDTTPRPRAVQAAAAGTTAVTAVNAPDSTRRIKKYAPRTRKGSR